MKAVIPAAGKGSRLQPLTDTTPKPLVEICGVPILAYCLNQLATTAVEEAVIVVGYHGEQIIRRFGDTYAGLSLTYVWQEKRKGMAHALLQAEDHVHDDFAVMDGDNIITADLAPLLDRQNEPETSGTILLDKVSAKEAREKAICELNADGSLAGITNKPENPSNPSHIAGGFHTFSPDIFTACELVRKSSRDEYELSKAIELLIVAGHSIRGVKHDSWTVNINTEAELRAAEDYFQDNPSLVPDDL